MSDVFARLRATMAAVLNCPVDAVTDQVRINKLKGWDSLAQLKLMLALEQEFGIAIAPPQAMRLLSFKAIVEFVAKSGPAEAAPVPERPADAAAAAALLTDGLARLGVVPGDIVLVHSFIGEVAALDGGPDRLIEALLAAVGPEGSIGMPLFTEAFTQGGAIDRIATPSEMGALTERFRTWPGACISPHPYHRFAFVGRRAADLAGPHGPTSFDAASSMAKMHEAGAKILMLSVDWDVVTFFHYLEERAEVPYRFHKDFTGTVTVDGRTAAETWTMHVRTLDSGIRNDFAGFGRRIDAAGLSRAAVAGPFHLRLADMPQVYDVTMAALAEDPYCLVAGRAP